MLRDSVADFVKRGTSIERMRRLRDTHPGFDREVWNKMAQLGWLGILVPQPCGGLGLGFAEMAIVAEGLARALVPEPFTAAAVLAGRAIQFSDNERLKSALLGELASGVLIPALAWQEAMGELDARAVRTRAEPFEGAVRLNGEKRFIAGADGADGFVVSARNPQGVELYWVPAATPGLRLGLSALADGRAFGALTLTDAVIAQEQKLASAAAGARAVERALNEALVVTGAELYGVMSRALEMSLDYMRTRVQFGRPIGSFQALQHRAVDLYIEQQLSSAVLEEALATLDGDPGDIARGAIASRVKSRCGDAALRITREAIQLHGAIGFTDEYDVGLYLKRALVLAAWLGNGAAHRRRYACLVPTDSE